MRVNEEQPTTVYHPRDITVGNGRILFAPRNKIPLWVLPGGRRTADEAEAYAAARAINDLTQ